MQIKLLNQYFAGISTDPDYSLYDVIQFYTQKDDLSTTFTFIDIPVGLHGYEIEPILRRMKNTAPGYDNLPALLFKKCSVELADVV